MTRRCSACGSTRHDRRTCLTWSDPDWAWCPDHPLDVLTVYARGPERWVYCPGCADAGFRQTVPEIIPAEIALVMEAKL